MRSANTCLILLQRAKNIFSNNKHHSSHRPARTAAQERADIAYLLKELRRRGPFVLWARSVEYDKSGKPKANNWLSKLIDEETQKRYDALPEERRATLKLSNMRMPVQAEIRRAEFGKLSQKEQEKWVVVAQKELHPGTAPYVKSTPSNFRS